MYITSRLVYLIGCFNISMTDFSIKKALLESINTDGILSGKILVGANLTLVQGRHFGLSSTLTQPSVHANYIDQPGDLEAKPVREMIRKINSERLLEASLGMAALNSVIDLPAEFEVADAYKEIEKHAHNKNVAVVGHFPFVDRLGKIAKNCWVFERKLRDGDIPSDKMPEFVPQADVLVLTAQVIANNCFHDIMELSPNSFKIMLGPSTPLSPVLFDFGIHVLGGVRVLDPELVYKLIAQGAHFKQLTGIEKITIKR